MKNALKWLVFPPLLFLLAASPAQENVLSLPTTKEILPNGLTVLVTEMPQSPVVTVDVFVKTGSAQEGKFLGAGLTHFLEHMLFKGTPLRGVGEIPKEVQALGGVINASTSMDRTDFTVTVPAKDFRKAMEILADMMRHPRLDKEEIEKEKEVVISEMRLYRDRPERYLSDLVLRTGYLEHPYRIPIIGFPELLKKIQREDFLTFYQQHYVPNNMIVSIAGNVTPAQALLTVKEYWADFPRGHEAVATLPPEPVQISPRRYEEAYPTDLARLSVSFPGVSLRDPDMYALDALAMILGEGETSRLYQELFKKQQGVRSISAGNITPLELGFFEIEATLDEPDIERVIEGIKAQIERIQKRGISSGELEQVKVKLLREYFDGLQTTEDVSYTVAFGEAVWGDPNFSKRYVAAVDRLTPADIRAVARQYLVPEKMSVVILNPLKKEAPAAVAPTSPAPPTEIKKVVLANGLRIFIHEDHRLPLVSMNLGLYGGTRFESAEINGLSFLTAQLWTKGTAQKTPEQLSAEMEKRGVSLGASSGDSSFGLQFEWMPQETDFALDLLEELITSPRFDPKEFEDIKRTMQTAIDERQDSIAKLTSMRLKEILFENHPFRLDEVGTRESVQKLSLKDARQFFKNQVVPSNMVLTIFGDVHSDEVLSKLRALLGGLKAGEFWVPQFTATSLTALREETLRMDKKQAMIMIGFPAKNMFSPDRHALQVLNTILASPFRGRLFTTIRDQFGQSYALGGRFVPLLDSGMMYFYVLTSPEQTPAVKATLLKILRLAQKEGFLADELRDAREYLKGTFAMGLQTQAALAQKCLQDELYGLGCEDFQSFDQKIDQVTLEEVNRLAQKYLDLKQAGIVVANPAPGAEDSK